MNIQNKTEYKRTNIKIGLCYIMLLGAFYHTDIQPVSFSWWFGTGLAFFSGFFLSDALDNLPGVK